jgi:hypothetical protein
MKKITLVVNLVIIIFIIAFFTVIFVKNFSNLKNLFVRPSLPENNTEELKTIINDLESSLKNYFELSNSAR